jgi:hypothetical protein
MKIDRGEVEKMLAACEPGSDTFLQVTEELTRRKLRELCRTWLAVQDAPVVPVSEQVAFDTPLAAMDWDSPCFKTTHARILRCDESGRLVRDGGE